MHRAPEEFLSEEVSAERSESFVHCASSRRIGPLSWFDEMFSPLSSVRLSMLAGICPTKKLEDRPSVSMLLKLPISGGIGPDKRLHGQLQDTTDSASAAKKLYNCRHILSS